MNNKNSQLKVGIVLNYINIILGNLIPLFYTPIMLRLLGQNEYGLYKLSSTATSYLSLISFGIGAAVTRYLIKANTEKGKEEEQRFFGLFLVIFRIIAVLSLIVGGVIILLLPIFYGNSLNSDELNRMRIIVLILVINTAINFAQSPYSSIVSAHENFVFLQITNILTTVVGPIVNLIVLYLGFASIGMAMSSLIIGVFVRLIFFLYVKKSMGYKPSYKNLPKEYLKEILLFSFWVFLANVVNQLYNSTDTVMIGMIPALATAGVAVYNIGATFNGIIFSLTTGISTMLAPRANKMVFSNSTEDELLGLCVKIGRIQAFIIALIATGFIAFGQPFINFYVGEGYEDAYWVAIFMIIPNMIPLVQSVCLSITIAKNKHKFRSLVYLGIAIVNVVGTWFAMKAWGIIGAAAVTGIALIIGQGFIMNWYYYKKVGINTIQFWKKVVNIYIVPIILCLVTLLVSRYVDFNKIPFFIFGVIIYTLLYAGFSWLFVMNQSEKDLFLNIIRNLKRKIIK